MVRLHVLGPERLADRVERLEAREVEHEEQRRVTAAKCQARIELLTRQKDDIDASIAELANFVAAIAKD